MVKFRFMDLEIWKESISLNDQIMDIADVLESSRHYRYAEQLRGAGLSISNNIAEGSGSYSPRDFANFLNFSRRSVFEVVNILIVINRRKYISDELLDTHLSALDMLSRKISNFRKRILNNN